MTGFPPLAQAVSLGPEIGRGSFGAVRRGVLRATGESVAVKLAVADLDGRDRERLEREVRLLEGMLHPRLTRFLGAFEAGDGRVALAYELLQGRPLDAVVAEGGHDLGDLVAWCRDIAAGLDFMHEAGLVHRDLKPGNLFLEESGRVKILDFGLARPEGAGATLTAEGMLLGTPEFMAPEQFRGERTTAASDLYSFGCVAYLLVTGRPPFEGTPGELVRAHLDGRVPSARSVAPETPLGVDAALSRMLAREPGERFPRAADFAVALAEGCEADGGPRETMRLPEVMERYRLRPTPSSGAARAPRRRALPAVLASLALAGALIAAAAWTGDPPSPRPTSGPRPPPPAAPRRAPSPFGEAYLREVREQLEAATALWRHEDGTVSREARPRSRKLLFPDPLHWGATVAALPGVRRFYQWVREGGRPEELPPEVLDGLREVDETFRGWQLPRPFFPYAYVQPAEEPVRRSAGGDDLGEGWIPRQADGWEGTCFAWMEDLETHWARIQGDLGRYQDGAAVEPLSGVLPPMIAGWRNSATDVLLHVWKSPEVRVQLASWLRPGTETLHAVHYTLARAARAEEAPVEELAALAGRHYLPSRAFVHGYLYTLDVGDWIGADAPTPALEMLRGEVLYLKSILGSRHFREPSSVMRETGRAYLRAARGLAPEGLGGEVRRHLVGRLLDLSRQFWEPEALMGFLPAGKGTLLEQAGAHPLLGGRLVVELAGQQGAALIDRGGFEAEELRTLAEAVTGRLDEVEPELQGEVPGALERLRAAAARLERGG